MSKSDKSIIDTVDLAEFDNLRVKSVDFNDFDSLTDQQAREFSKYEFGAALEVNGFIQMDYRKTPAFIFENLRRAQQDFFYLSQDKKNEVDGAHLNKYERGYKPLKKFLAGKAEIKETFQIGPWGMARRLAEDFNRVAIPDNHWPDEALVPRFEEAVKEFYLARLWQKRLYMRAMALYLDMDKNALLPKSQHSEDVLRLLYYPGIDRCDMAHLKESFNGKAYTWAVAHPDLSFGTLLQAETGLQVWDKAEQKWMNAKTDSDKTVCNSGLSAEIMSNGLIPATPHRVVIPQGALDSDRFAAPFFFNLNPSTTLQPSADAIQKRGGVNYYPEKVTLQSLVVDLGHREYNRRRKDLLARQGLEP